MSATYYVLANQDQGGHWSFTEEQIKHTAAEIRPDAKVFGPDEPHGAYIIKLPGESRRAHEVVYMTSGTFSFREEDEIDITAGFVFRFLQRLAPDTPTVWVDIDGEVNPFQVSSLTPEEFVRELWEKA